MCALASASTCMPSPTATMSGSAACGSRTRAASPDIRTPTSRCMRWSMPSSARSPTATSACIFRRATRNGAARPPTSFLAFAVERVRARGGRIAHLDVTIVCEAPRIGPHRDAMRARIAEIAGIAVDRVGVKATTSEKLGFTGRGEGIVAIATATVRLPWSGCMIDAALRRRRHSACSTLCRARGLTIATAESCTGGLVAAALTEIAGSSDVVDRGFVTYSNEAKHEMLGVPAATLDATRRGEPRDRRGHGAAARWHTRRPILRSRSPASPGPGGGSTESRSGSCILRPRRATGRSSHARRRFGDIGRRQVRRLGR